MEAYEMVKEYMAKRKAVTEAAEREKARLQEIERKAYDREKAIRAQKEAENRARAEADARKRAAEKGRRQATPVSERISNKAHEVAGAVHGVVNTVHQKAKAVDRTVQKVEKRFADSRIGSELADNRKRAPARRAAPKKTAKKRRAAPKKAEQVTHQVKQPSKPQPVIMKHTKYPSAKKSGKRFATR